MPAHLLLCFLYQQLVLCQLFYMKISKGFAWNPGVRVDFGVRQLRVLALAPPIWGKSFTSFLTKSHLTGLGKFS